MCILHIVFCTVCKYVLSICKLLLLFFCTVWSTLIRISLTKALVLWWCDNKKSDLIIEHRYSLHSDRYEHAARMNQCFVLFAGSVHSNDAQSRLADIIYSSQTEQTGCEEWQSIIRMEQSVDAKDVQLSFLVFFFVLCLSFHFKWQTVEFIYSSLLHFSLC